MKVIYSTVFGMSLAELYSVSKIPVPLVVSQCIDFLTSNNHMLKEGLFRIASSQAEVEHFKSLFMTPITIVDLSAQTSDPHVVASLLKQFFIQIGEPLIEPNVIDIMIDTFNKYHENFVQIRTRLIYVLQNLPPLHLAVLRTMFAFLAELVKHASINKMTSYNLGVCFGATIFPTDDITKINTSINIAVFLIDHFQTIFPALSNKAISELPSGRITPRTLSWNDTIELARNGDLDGLARWLNINYFNEGGKFLLHTLIRDSNCPESSIQFLLSLGALVNIQEPPQNSTLLHLACTRGSYDLILDLLRRGADSRLQNARGAYPIHLFCSRRIHTNPTPIIFEIAHLLIAPIDINSADDFGNTPLHYAIRNDNNDRAFLIEWLIDHGADTELRNYKQINPYQKSLLKGTDSITDILKSLYLSTEQPYTITLNQYLSNVCVHPKYPFEIAYRYINTLLTLPTSEYMGLLETPYLLKSAIPLSSGTNGLSKSMLDTVACYDLDEKLPYTRTQYIALLLNEFYLKLDQFKKATLHRNGSGDFTNKRAFLTLSAQSVPIKKEHTEQIINSESSFLGALYCPYSDEGTIEALLMIHSKYISTEKLLELLCINRHKYGYLTNVLRIWYKHWYIFIPKLRSRDTVMSLLASIDITIKQKRATEADFALQTQILSLRNTNVSLKKHNELFKNLFTMSQVVDFDTIDDEDLLMELTIGDYIIQKRIDHNSYFSEVSKLSGSSVPRENAQYHYLAIQKFITLIVLQSNEMVKHLHRVRRILKLTRELLELGNIAGASQFMKGLDHYAVQRLVHLWPSDLKNEYSKYKTQVHVPVIVPKYIYNYDMVQQELRPHRSQMCTKCLKLSDLRIVHDILFKYISSTFDTNYETLIPDDHEYSYLTVIWNLNNFITDKILFKYSFALFDPPPLK